MTPSRAAYRNGSRTPECRQANALYEQQRQRRKVPPFVAAGRARAHVRELLAAGMSMNAIAKQANVSRATLHQLLGSCCGYSRKRRIRPAVESRLLAVHPDVVSPETTSNAERLAPEPWWLERLPDGLDLTWRERRACANIPTYIFFPGRGDRETLRAAQRICEQCPVREPCLAFALAVQPMGIWGGKTEQ